MPARSAALLVLLVSLSGTVYSRTPVCLAVACAWSLAVAGLHLYMERTGRRSSARGFYFSCLAVFFLLNMHAASLGRLFTPYCHVGLAGNCLHVVHNQYLSLANGAWCKYGTLSLGVLWLLVVLVNGGGFCGWVCFFGGIDDFFSRALKKPPLKLSGGRKWRVFQLASLVFFASMSFVYMEPLFCKWACPFKATAEILNQDSPAVALQTTVFLILGSVFLVILPLLSGKRTFCSAVCPFGAIPPLLERLNPYKVTAGGKCTGCGTCESVCPSFAIERDEGRYRPNRYCTSCFKCVDSCPAGALRPTLFHMKESGLLPFVSMAFGGALSLFYVPGGALAFARALGIIPK